MVKDKEGAMMELELPDASSDADHKKTEKDDYSDYIAPPQVGIEAFNSQNRNNNRE